MSQPQDEETTLAVHLVRHECLIPEGGLFCNSKELLPEFLSGTASGNNNTKQAVKTLSSKLTEDSGQRQCHNTKRGKAPHGQATVFCVDCGKYYCESCESNHKLFDITSDHQLQSIHEVDATTVEAAQQTNKNTKMQPASSLSAGHLL